MNYYASYINSTFVIWRSTCCFLCMYKIMSTYSCVSVINVFVSFICVFYLCMCMCILLLVFLFSVYLYIYNVCECIWWSMYAFICAYVCMHIFVHMFVYVSVCVYGCVFVHIGMCSLYFICRYTFVCIYTCMYMCILYDLASPVYTIVSHLIAYITEKIYYSKFLGC